MTKLLHIMFILLLINSNLFSQTANGNITATITTPVGMEISNDINLNNLSERKRITTVSDYTRNSKQNKSNSLFKIIGESFSHNISVENYVALHTKSENERTISVRKRESFVGITVNFE